MAGRLLLFRLEGVGVLGFSVLVFGLFVVSSSPARAASNGLKSRLSEEAAAASASSAQFLTERPMSIVAFR